MNTADDRGFLGTCSQKNHRLIQKNSGRIKVKKPILLIA